MATSKTGYRGVSPTPATGRFRAHLSPGGKFRYIGTYDTAEDAARAYNAKALEEFGSDAILNDVPESTTPPQRRHRIQAGASGYYGVHKHIRRTRTVYEVRWRNERYGSYDTADEAATVYNRMLDEQGDTEMPRNNVPDGIEDTFHGRRSVGMHDSSGFRGVCKNPDGRFRAYIQVDKKQRHIGFFATPEAAAKAYNETAVKLLGDKARTNSLVGAGS